MAFLPALTASLTLHPAHVVPMAESSGLKRGIANSVAVDDSDAGACARGKRMQSRQLAVGTSVGTRITIYEKN